MLMMSWEIHIFSILNLVYYVLNKHIAGLKVYVLTCPKERELRKLLQIKHNWNMNYEIIGIRVRNLKDKTNCE